MIKKLLLIQILVLSSLVTNTMAQGSTALVPVINYLLSETPPPPYAPPANSIDSTSVTTTNDDTMRVDLIPNGVVVEGYKGKIVLLEVYAYWCPHCLSAIPEFNNLKEKYPDDVYILTMEEGGLNHDQLKQYVIDKGIQYDTVANEKSGKILNWVPRLLGHRVYGFPTLLVFDRDGKYVRSYLPPDFDVVDDLIWDLL